MPFQERNAWAYGLIAVAGYAVYLALVLPRLGGPISEVGYQLPLLACVGGAVLAGILAGIVLGALVPKGVPREDVRDRQIGRFGERLGSGTVILGAVVALLLALFAADPFWIANAIYLGFVLSAVVSAAARIVAYRRGIPG